MPAKDYKIRRRIYLPQSDGSKKEKVIYANSEYEFEQKKNKALDLANERINNVLNPTFEAVADQWNEYHEKHISYNTWSCYQAPLKDLKKEFGDIPIKKINPKDIQLYLDELFNLGFAKQTINLRKIVADLVFKYAITNIGLNILNPVTNVKINSLAKKSKRQLPDDDIIKTITENVDEPFGLFPFIVMCTGYRKGEVAALDYEDFDFDNDTINLNKSIYYKSTTPYVKTPKTKSGIRKTVLLSILKEKIPKNKKGHIFCDEKGNYLRKGSLESAWTKYKDKIGIDVGFHQLRHAYATLLYDAGIDVKTASVMMGHSKIETTMNIYTHIKNSRFENSAVKLENYFANNFSKTEDSNNDQSELIKLQQEEIENLRKQLALLQK